MTIPTERQVLPSNVRPSHYTLTLAPDLEEFVFEGRVKIDLDVNDASKTIVVNVQEIDISSAVLSVVSGETQTSTKITYDEDLQIATLYFANEVKAGSKAVLDISFKGILNDKMNGFYRSTYKDSEGNTKYLASTQFEATSARRAFPCWDEPAIKATFDVTLVVPTELTALSNMDVVSEEVHDSKKDVVYRTTPIMSTYLLAFVVGPFEYIEAFTSGEHNGRKIRSRVYTLPGTAYQGRHALQVCTEALEYFAKVFGEPYPLPKMDMVAIPDFDSGAMENWGLVTYRTVALLFDDERSSIETKKTIGYVVCHELAHQWFGNLVTMEWWDHLWLNEGFATWVGWFALDHIHPEWDVWTNFVTDSLPSALVLDSLRSSHPIEVAVKDPKEVSQIFDAISYLKGASVIRMLSSWLGVETFLEGIRQYIQAHKFSNASTDDLWAALSDAAGVDVSEFMTLWTRRVGYPLLRVTLNGSGSITVTQTRYLSTGDVKEEEDDTIWWTPLNILTPEGLESYTLTDKSQTFSVPSHGIFKINAGQKSIYRVNYPLETIEILSNEIKKGQDGLLKDSSDRIGLIDDAANLCISGDQSTVAFLRLAQNFENETDYFVWSQITIYLARIKRVWGYQPTEVQDQLTALTRHLFVPVINRLGWEFHSTEDDITKSLRVMAIDQAGDSKDPATIREANERFDRLIKGDNDAVYPSVRGEVYRIVIKSAETEEEKHQRFEEILSIYHDESLPNDQQLNALKALGSIKSDILLKKLLQMSLDEKQVRAQNIFSIITPIARNHESHALYWEFFKENYYLFEKKFVNSISTLGSLVQLAIQGFVSLDKIKEAEEFFADKEKSPYVRPLDQALEAARVNAKWLLRDHDSVASWASAYAVATQV
ncbi:hypothetical protein PHYBLDRAFT_154347 [Phycomyces blakesleeanus NRRL 1555(-)]|uniref:Aminopeptidase n=2 Tax=Phycomyces blakesleeanus TaxID=4837 RepID=A0A167PNU0_PHYB8|nr:hypothetical protein PHYBLDRAFT_154347 [Phycomyces blakesleeanus NRRL 1555(-)]OAD78274.1 hypothetical protein PHYBLDRAFT_154347 [Phycomyces blakesleeanus NRRL 1555(-)]|eukprot:XP_018296314.1 hypothetical protein PHYBLDRAFT_154347 [Phycomyces blakesleeanus NRRL 1555(-)]